MGGAPKLSIELRAHLVPPAARRIEELQHSLQKKDGDLRAMEERYRRYVDRARAVRMLGTLLASCPGHCCPPGDSLPPGPMPILLHHATDFCIMAGEAKVTLTVAFPNPRSYRPWNPSSSHLGGLP